MSGDELLTKADLQESLREFERRLTWRIGTMIAGWTLILAVLELVAR